MFTCRISDRHELRLLQLQDAPELFALVDANRAHLRVWLPWLDRNLTVADTRQFIRFSLEQLAEQSGLITSICYDGQMVGVVSFNRFDWQNRQAIIGYWLAASHQGRGLMTASCRTLINYGFQELDLHRMVIMAATDNHRSRAVPERLGFTHEGTNREAEWLYDRFVDLEVYACLRHEWSTSG